MAAPCLSTPSLLAALLALILVGPLRGASNATAGKNASKASTVTYIDIDPVVEQFGTTVGVQGRWPFKSQEGYCIVLTADAKTHDVKDPPSGQDVKAMANIFVAASMAAVSTPPPASSGSSEKASSMEKVLQTSIQCRSLPKEKCTHACDWQNGECDISELTALLLMGQPKVEAESEATECGKLSKDGCPDDKACEWDDASMQCALKTTIKKQVEVDCHGQSELACKAAASAANAVARQDVKCNALLEPACSGDCSWDADAATPGTQSASEVVPGATKGKCGVSAVFAAASLSYAGPDENEAGGSTKETGPGSSFINHAKDQDQFCHTKTKDRCTDNCDWDEDRQECSISPAAAMATMGAMAKELAGTTTTWNVLDTTAAPATASNLRRTDTTTLGPTTPGAAPVQHAVYLKLKEKDKECGAIKDQAKCRAGHDCTWRESKGICEISGVFAMSELSRGSPGETEHDAKVQLENLANSYSSTTSNMTRAELGRISASCRIVKDQSKCLPDCEWDTEKGICDVSPLIALHAVLSESTADVVGRLLQQVTASEVTHSKQVVSAAVLTAEDVAAKLLTECSPVALHPDPRPCLDAKGQAVFWFTSIKSGQTYVAYCTDSEGQLAQTTFTAKDKGASGVVPSNHSGNSTNGTKVADGSTRVAPLSVVAVAAVLIGCFAFFKDSLPCTQRRGASFPMADDQEMLQGHSQGGGGGGGAAAGFAESQTLRWAQLQGGPE